MLTFTIHPIITLLVLFSSMAYLTLLYRLEVLIRRISALEQQKSAVTDQCFPILTPNSSRNTTPSPTPCSNSTTIIPPHSPTLITIPRLTVESYKDLRSCGCLYTSLSFYETLFRSPSHRSSAISIFLDQLHHLKNHDTLNWHSMCLSTLEEPFQALQVVEKSYRVCLQNSRNGQCEVLRMAEEVAHLALRDGNMELVEQLTEMRGEIAWELHLKEASGQSKMAANHWKCEKVRLSTVDEVKRLLEKSMTRKENPATECNNQVQCRFSSVARSELRRWQAYQRQEGEEEYDIAQRIEELRSIAMPGHTKCLKVLIGKMTMMRDGLWKEETAEQELRYYSEAKRFDDIENLYTM